LQFAIVDPETTIKNMSLGVINILLAALADTIARVQMM